MFSIINLLLLKTYIIRGGFYSMAFIQCDFYSQVLGFSTSMNVILPGDSKINKSQDKMDYPVLYLLHGLSDDHTIWGRRSSIDRYVRDLNIAIVMPNAGRSFYTDMLHGYDYYTFINEELQSISESFFPISTKREDRFIAGLSMGGYGALKIALSNPDRYAYAASLSGAVDISAIANRFMEEESIEAAMEFKNIFGDLDTFDNSSNDLFSLANSCAMSPTKPKIYLSCGTEDFLYEDNIRFKNHLQRLPFDFTYEEEPGDHNWDYWDLKIQSVIDWLGIK